MIILLSMYVTMYYQTGPQTASSPQQRDVGTVLRHVSNGMKICFNDTSIS